jgi:hypothetical protein
MARRKAAGRPARSKKALKQATIRRIGRAAISGARKPKRASAKRKPTGRAAGARARKVARPARKAAAPKASAVKTPARTARAAKPRASARAQGKIVAKVSRLDRQRRTLEDIIPTPPSSLDMDRRGSAVRTGRAEMAETRENLGGMSALTGGDLDADAENAYFSGEEAPGGDNPTPDQDIVDDIGKAIGVEYQDNEELRTTDKVTERDRHRWELDPASSEDYKDRK